jgi:glyoxylase-like metal-dependent hydrolase (beta-lactamase superfamily II)
VTTRIGIDMKKLLGLLLVVFAAAFGALAVTFTANDLPVPAAPALAIPGAQPPAELRLRAIFAGKMFSRAALAFRGGSFGDARIFGMGAILVEHPQGTLLFDSGFARDVDQHFLTTPWLMQATTKYAKEATVAEQLAKAGIALESIKAVVLTHAHWDHVSGLADLPGVPVWVTQAERDFVDSGDEATVLARQLGTQNYVVYEFEGGPYLGFPRSFDVFGDGSVVLVPAPGHTPGSIIAFIALPDSHRYALIGDLAWQSEGVDLPAEKPWIARRKVDVDAAKVRDLLVHMHQLQDQMPDLTVVPAHDRRVWETLRRL